MFAMRRGERLVHFYPSALAVDMCGTGPVVRVRVTPDDAGTHWAWCRTDGVISMVYDHEDIVRMCAPDGFAFAEQAGEGRVRRVRAEVIGEAEVARDEEST
jgi:hypothetical protein